MKLFTDVQSLLIDERFSVRAALARMNQAAQGILLMVDDQGVLQRTLTDGDLRRLILDGYSLDDTVALLPEQPPIVALELSSSRDLLQQMNVSGVNHLVIVDAEKKPVDVVRRKDVDTSILLSTPHLGDEETQFVTQAFNTNWIAPVGPNIDAFEQELAEKVGSKYAVAVSSGTAAIHLALRVLNVGRGDTVFCSSFTFVASANPIVYQGATPVFIDSEPDSWNMSPQALARAMVDAEQKGSLPKAVIVVSLYGQSADMDALLAICDRYQVPIIEDAAESLGASYKGKASGTFGVVGIYSFNGNKIITTSAGGMLVTNDGELAAHAKKLSTQARENVVWYEHTEVGYNYRMSNILAGVGRGQLKVLDERVNARRAVFAKYQELFADMPALEWMPEASYGRATHWLTALLLPKGTNVDVIVREMQKENIEVRPLWKPMHQQPVFKEYAYFPHQKNKSLCDDWFERGICLPSGSNLSDEQVLRVANVFRKVLAGC